MLEMTTLILARLGADVGLMSLHLGREPSAIAHERITEGVLQRTQPWPVVPPLIDPVTEDRLTDLLRAGRTHAACRLVELKAGRLE
jgi:hypothetical protein